MDDGAFVAEGDQEKSKAVDALRHAEYYILVTAEPDGIRARCNIGFDEIAETGEVIPMETTVLAGMITKAACEAAITCFLSANPCEDNAQRLVTSFAFSVADILTSLEKGRR